MSEGHSASHGPTSGSTNRSPGRQTTGRQTTPSAASAGRGQISYSQHTQSSYRQQPRNSGSRQSGPRQLGSRQSGSRQSGSRHSGPASRASDQSNQWASPCENVGSTERVISAGLGGLLVASGIVRGRLPGLVLTAVGASLLYRGLSGFCAMYQQLGIDTCHLPQNSGSAQPGGSRLASGPLAAFMPEHQPVHGIKIEESFTVQRPAHELYELWTKWEELPKYLPHIEKIETLEGDRTRWSARAPLGVLLTWEAEIIKQEADRMVSWKSTSGDVATAGSVHFQSQGDKQTEVKVNMQYDPPGGKTVAAVAEFFNMGLDQRVRDDLQHFKRQLESNK